MEYQYIPPWQRLFMPTEKEGNGRGWICQWQHCISGDAKQK
jgi:hypothetical protein